MLDELNEARSNPAIPCTQASGKRPPKTNQRGHLQRRQSCARCDHFPHVSHFDHNLPCHLSIPRGGSARSPWPAPRSLAVRPQTEGSLEVRALVVQGGGGGVTGIRLCVVSASHRRGACGGGFRAFGGSGSQVLRFGGGGVGQRFRPSSPNRPSRT